MQIVSVTFVNCVGSPVPEKPPAVTVVPGPPVASMYSAPSDTKLDCDLTPTPTHRPFDELTPTEEAKMRAAHTLNRLSGESAHTFIPDPDADGGGPGYVPFVDYSGRDYAPVPNGRRASFSDLGPYITPEPSLSPAAPDFCTIRRGTRISQLGVGNGTNSLLGSAYHDAPTLRLNGTAHALASRHSSYAAHLNSSYGSPPPPPYPRGSKVGSPRGSSSPTGPATLALNSAAAHGDERASPETKYIFSPEAMMKPGTLV
ncbi:uncharacterized protein LOC119575530 [Penaeus monodon]|uniref:uncharacterized protein LOC119575530 n=1 Tax=Penaeus monodon TaxID=6687 RepID=UPI0018A71B34|nr:uncharacterized protein LOC119575530 [Penaeus monodon]